MRTLVCAGTFWMASAVFAAPLVYEPFDYPAGTLDGRVNPSTGTPWALAGISANDINVFTGNLTAPSPLEAAVGNLLAITGSTGNSGGSFRLGFADPTTDPPTPTPVTAPATLYFSFLLRVDSVAVGNNTAGGFFAGLNTMSGPQGSNVTAVAARVQCRIDPVDVGRYNLGIFNNRNASAASLSWASAQLVPGETHFIVAVCELNSGASNDVSRLWISPDPGTFGAAAPPPTVSDETFATNDLAQVASVLVRQVSTSPLVTLDELRVGLTWADVTPVGVPCHDPIFDADGDHDVDMRDFASFQVCREQPATGDCRCFDKNGSGTIDGFDLEAFTNCAPAGGVFRDSVEANAACDD